MKESKNAGAGIGPAKKGPISCARRGTSLRSSFPRSGHTSHAAKSQSTCTSSLFIQARHCTTGYTKRVPLKLDEEDDSTTAAKKLLLRPRLGTAYHRHIVGMSYRKSVDPRFSVRSRSRYSSPLVSHVIVTEPLSYMNT